MPERNEHLDEGLIHAWLDGALSPDESARVERYWAPARTTSVFAGYDPCGKPTYRTVCVPGHWATRPICD